MPLVPRLVIGAVLVLAGAVLLTVAVLGARSRLPRNTVAGVRTRATMRSEDAFELANRTAAPVTGAAGLVAVTGGTVLLVGGPGAGLGVVLAVTAVGTLVLAGVGGVLGDRAAVALAARSPGPPACGGGCAGCDLVAGCRPDPAGDAGPATGPDPGQSAGAAGPPGRAGPGSDPAR